MTSVAERPLSAQQQNVDATTRLRQSLGLDDPKLLSAAIAVVASDEVARNSEFAERIRAAYSRLATLKPFRSTKPANTTNNSPKLVPVTTIEGLKIDPYAKLDPYFICKIYGVYQLRDAMTGYSLAKLKEAVEFVQAKYPGTKPKTKSRKDDIIDYIVTYVNGAE